MEQSSLILLHICCAPCATTVIKRLEMVGYKVYGYFYNPNIHPTKEYYQRLAETKRICQIWDIPLLIGDYDWDRWQAAVHGLEKEKEGGKRCLVCYRFRLAAVAQKAKELEIGAVASTLTLSPKKRASDINSIGKEICEELGLKFYEADWKKQDGFKQSVTICKEMNIYRQNYCGCKYSIRPTKIPPTKVITEVKNELAESLPKHLRKKKTKPWRQK
ncbi:MAG: epoxyqueuosine reductase QueH [candidate division WOR-3 bacterium]